MSKTEKNDEVERFHSTLFDTVKVKIELEHEPLYLLVKKFPKRVRYYKGQHRVYGKFKKTYALIASAKGHKHLFIEASIPKFLSGQNIVGTMELKAASIEFILAVLKRGKFTPKPDELKKIKEGQFQLMRVDIANHLPCRNEKVAAAIMWALRMMHAAKDQPFSAYSHETLYWRQRSSKASLKAYRKRLQLQVKKYRLQDDVRYRKALLKRAEGAVRFELTLRSDELKRRRLKDPNAWTPEIAQQLLEKQVAGVLPLKGSVVDVKGMRNLSKTQRDRLELFLRGKSDAFSSWPGAFAKDRREVLKHTGIDVKSVLTPMKQAACMRTLQQEFDDGWDFQAREKLFKKLKQGR